MNENEENKNLITVNSNDENQNLNPNIEIKNTNDIRNLWNDLDKNIKNINLNDLNNTEKIKFKLHNNDFNFKVAINVTKTYDNKQKVLLWLLPLIPAAFILLVMLPVMIAGNIVVGMFLISVALVMVVISILCLKQVKQNPKKTIINSETISEDIKSKFQKITLIKKDGIFEKEYLGFNSSDTFEDIKSKINEEWILERKSDFLSNHQGLMEKINIFSVEVKRTDDSNYLLVQFKVKEKRVRTLKKATNEIVLEKNLEPIKFEFLILL